MPGDLHAWPPPVLFRWIRFRGAQAHSAVSACMSALLQVSSGLLTTTCLTTRLGPLPAGATMISADILPMRLSEELPATIEVQVQT